MSGNAMDDAREWRKLPRIDRLLERAEAQGSVARFGRERVLDALRAAVERARREVARGGKCPESEVIFAQACEALERASRPALRPAINATGVVLHTNLGRSPLAEEAVEAMAAVARGYSTLEYDVESGTRGSRYVHCRELLARLTGAEDALVVNNNAAAVMLVLAALCRSREVVISRGQLVEIGGGFRVPDVMRESGAALVEVGTTNRTYAADYERAITERTAALMVVHRSNFRITGFTCDPSLEELADLAHRRGLWLLDDLGSGTLLDTAAIGLPHEPTIQERVAARADVICFSGDKLLGGPQAGFIVGRAELIARLERFPLLRALRVDKVTLAGIEATLRLYERGEALARIPVWRALGATAGDLRARARGWMEQIRSPAARLVEAESAVGGGSLPGLSLPSPALGLSVAQPDAVARALRTGEPPVVARVEQGMLILDPRTVLPQEDAALVEAVSRVLGPRRGQAEADGQESRG